MLRITVLTIGYWYQLFHILINVFIVFIKICALPMFHVFSQTAMTLYRVVLPSPLIQKSMGI